MKNIIGLVVLSFVLFACGNRKDVKQEAEASEKSAWCFRSMNCTSRPII